VKFFRLIFLYFLCLIFYFSCNLRSIEYKILEKEGVFEVYVENSPLFYVYSIENNRNEIKTLIAFILRHFKGNIKPQSVLVAKKINYKNPYQLFFEIGDNLYYNWKNILLKTGIIENEWFIFLNKYHDKLEILKKEKNNIFRLYEIDNFLAGIDKGGLAKVEAFKYSVKFLLRENLYTSMQEFFSRPNRYFKSSEIESIFYRMVVIPEVLEFTRYLIKKFGKKKVIDLAQNYLATEKWKLILGEEINDIEAEFSKYIENYKFKLFSPGSNYVNEFEKLIITYNRNTKEVLFKK